ncbi:carbohydrate binding domain-containing protein [Nonomuraea sp. NPDC049480]|uniref:carbohydrate binding domain-containing protein n=1 Tax=Nonomuraea sp. NPDC049480 TaxID=3364353 RepID=UPI0037AFFA12
MGRQPRPPLPRRRCGVELQRHRPVRLGVHQDHRRLLTRDPARPSPRGGPLRRSSHEIPSAGRPLRPGTHRTPLHSSPAAAANILANPGFESGLTGWTCSAGSGAAAVSSPVHGGAKALRAIPAGSDIARCRQTVTVRPGTGRPHHPVIVNLIRPTCSRRCARTRWPSGCPHR